MAVLCAAVLSAEVVAAPLAYLRGGMFSPGCASVVEAARPWWSALLRPFLHYADSCSGVDGGGRPRRRRQRVFLISTTAGLLLFGKGMQGGPGYRFLAPGVGVLADGGESPSCGVSR